MIDPTDKNIYKPYLELVDKTITEFQRLFGRKPILLDAGCGHSTLLEQAYSKCEKVIGVDLDKEGLEKNQLIDEKMVSDLTKIPLPNSSVDIIVSAWVLEHIEHPDDFIKEANRLLTEKGYFVFIAPNANSVYVLLSKLIPDKFHSLVAEKLYKRQKGDTFKAYYRMNTLVQLDKLMSQYGLIRKNFIYNDDPKYFGFSVLTKPFAYLWNAIIMIPYLRKYRAHIIGIYQKG